MSSIASKPSKTGRITLNLSHIPGSANAVADTLSTKYYEQKNRTYNPTSFILCDSPETSASRTLLNKLYLP